MKIYLITSILCLLYFTGQSQQIPKGLIINKKQIIPKNWINSIQEKGDWKYIQKVEVKKKKITNSTDYINNIFWRFKKEDIVVPSIRWNFSDENFKNYTAKFYDKNKIIVIGGTFLNGKNPIDFKEIYKVINLTNKYLVLEKIEDTYCFDYSLGKKLSKQECKKKHKNKQKYELDKLFGGKKSKNQKKKIRLIFELQS